MVLIHLLRQRTLVVSHAQHIPCIASQIFRNETVCQVGLVVSEADGSATNWRNPSVHLVTVVQCSAVSTYLIRTAR